jgi:CubicO group peptidase (beta-lactamase class C family)
MQQNIWKPLNATNMTFRPTKHFSNGTPPFHEPATRVGNSLGPDPAVPLWPIDPKDAIGGAGLFGTANDYIKLLTCLLQGGSPILKTSSVEEMFRPQFGEANIAAFRAWVLMAGGGRIFRQSGDEETKDELMPLGISLAGQVNMEDVQGRRKKGTVAWGGLPNLTWWVDREGGVAATLFTQVVPAGDVQCREMILELEEALYRVKEGKK